MTIEYANIFQPPLPQGNLSYIWENLYGSSIGLALTSTIAQSDHPILIVVPDSLIASLLMEEFHFFDHSEHRIMLFPDWETLPYDYFSPHQDIISERLATLAQLTTFRKGAIVTTISTLMHRLAPREYLDGQGFFLKIGDQLNIDILRTRLTKANYRSVGQVREHGEFAVRGSIVDLFPMGSKQPFRIDLLDNEVDSIRIFSTESQRSTEKVEEIHLLPGREFPLIENSIEQFLQHCRQSFAGNPLQCPIYQDISEGIASPGIEYYLPLFFEKTASLFDYLPKNTLIVSVGDTLNYINEFWQEINSRYEQGRFDTTRPLLPPDKMFISDREVSESIKKYANIHIRDSGSPQASALRSRNNEFFSFSTLDTPGLNINHKATQPLSLLQEFVNNYSERILFSVETIGRREIILQLLNN